jgi:predicted kinase
MQFRARATELGARSKLIFLDVPRDELRRRLAKRRESLPPKSRFRVDLDQLNIWADMFQTPTADELE